MILPDELVAKLAIPAIRALIARRLMTTHGLTQKQVADRLGITQAAVSNYVNGKRGITFRIEDYPEVERGIIELSESLSKGKVDESTIMTRMTEICDYIRLQRLMCTPHKQLEPGLDVLACHACDEPLLKRPEITITSLNSLKDALS
jgi:predicted transcriptional regulator